VRRFSASGNNCFLKKIRFTEMITLILYIAEGYYIKAKKVTKEKILMLPLPK
jgi:hypothetical protein